MTFEQLKEYFGTATEFHRQTGMDRTIFYYWKNKGYIPHYSQLQIEYATNGELLADVANMEKEWDERKKPNKVN